MSKSGKEGGRYDSEVLDALRSATSTKLLLFALLCGGAGLILLGTSEDASRLLQTYVGNWTVFGATTIGNLGGSLFSAAVILVAFELYVRRQSSAMEVVRMQALKDGFEERLTLKLPAMLELGDETVAADMAKLVNSEQLRELGLKTLGAALDAPEPVRRSVSQLEAHLSVSREVWRSLRIHMTLRPKTEGSAGNGAYFDVNITCSFSADTVGPITAVCTTSQEDHARMLASRKYLWVWYHEATSTYPNPTSDVFELIECSVDGAQMEIESTMISSGLLYRSADVEPDGPAQVSIRLRARIQKRGHCLYFNIPRMCDSVRYDLDYSDCGIRYVNVLESLGGARRASIERIPGAPDRVIVESSEWLSPQAGVAFVWVFDAEMMATFLRSVNVKRRRRREGA